MEHGEASKLALYGVADYTWNTADFNAIDNWERGIEALTPEAADAYRTFAIHSCDTETGYRRAESWETRTFRIAEYTQEEYDALLREFLAIEQVPARMEAGCRNKALLGELRPWLTEFGKLGTRGRKTLELIKTYEAGDAGAFWAAYVGNLMTEQEREAYEAHKSGTMKLQPFYENAMDDMVAGFFTRLTGDVPASYRGIGTFANVRTTLSKLMFDNDSTTFYTSGVAQKEGDWTGADLGRVRDVEVVRILQGRNSVDDVDYFDHAVVEYSEDGKTWTPLTGELEKQYVINWSGEPVRARYVRLKRLESPRTNWASVRSFEVNPVRAERLGFEIEAEDAAQALYAFDRNPGTSFENRGVLKFGIPEGTKQYTLLLKLPAEGAVTVAAGGRRHGGSPDDGGQAVRRSGGCRRSRDDRTGGPGRGIRDLRPVGRTAGNGNGNGKAGLPFEEAPPLFHAPGTRRSADSRAPVAAEDRRHDDGGKHLGARHGQPDAGNPEQRRQCQETDDQKEKSAQQGHRHGGPGLFDALEITDRDDVEGEEDETRGEKRQTADGNAVGRIGRIKEHAHDPGAAQGRKEEKEKSHGNCRGHGQPEGRPDPVAASAPKL